MRRSSRGATALVQLVADLDFALPGEKLRRLVAGERGADRAEGARARAFEVDRLAVDAKSAVGEDVVVDGVFTLKSALLKGTFGGEE